MGLMQRILSSVTQDRPVAVQPYLAVIGTPVYGNRFISPEMVAPGVSNVILSNGQPTQVPRDVQLVTSSPSPVVLQNGAAPTYGNNAPGRGV